MLVMSPDPRRETASTARFATPPTGQASALGQEDEERSEEGTRLRPQGGRKPYKEAEFPSLHTLARPVWITRPHSDQAFRGGRKAHPGQHKPRRCSHIRPQGRRTRWLHQPAQRRVETVHGEATLRGQRHWKGARRPFHTQRSAYQHAQSLVLCNGPAGTSTANIGFKSPELGNRSHILGT